MFELLKKETLRIVEKLGLQESDFECQFIKGFGKGGQKKNKTNNCVYLVHSPTGESVKMQKYREREANLKTALRILIEKVEMKQDPKNSKTMSKIDKLREKKRRAKKKSKKKYNPEEC